MTLRLMDVESRTTLGVTIVEYIRLRRTRLGMSQRDLANAIGAFPPLVSRWERARKAPSRRFIRRVAEVLQCTVEDLIE
jgi:transcriptional regulator with XRE-family HTH domain